MRAVLSENILIAALHETDPEEIAENNYLESDIMAVAYSSRKGSDVVGKIYFEVDDNGSAFHVEQLQDAEQKEHELLVCRMTVGREEYNGLIEESIDSVSEPSARLYGRNLIATLIYLPPDLRKTRKKKKEE